MISADDYRKSSYSGLNSCVEVQLLDDGTVGVRDSKDKAKPPHFFTQEEWLAFVAGVRAGEFDLPVDEA